MKNLLKYSCTNKIYCGSNGLLTGCLNLTIAKLHIPMKEQYFWYYFCNNNDVIGKIQQVIEYVKFLPTSDLIKLMRYL